MRGAPVTRLHHEHDLHRGPGSARRELETRRGARNGGACESDGRAGSQQASELPGRVRGEILPPSVQKRQCVPGHTEHRRRERRAACTGGVGDLPENGPGSHTGCQRAVLRQARGIAGLHERGALVQRVVQRDGIGCALGTRRIERRSVGERERRQADRYGEETGDGRRTRGRAMQREECESERDWGPARGPQAGADRGLEKAPEQHREGEAGKQRRRRERHGRARAQRPAVARAAGEQQPERHDRSHGGHVDGTYAGRPRGVRPAERKRDDGERPERAGRHERGAGRRRQAVRERRGDRDCGAVGDVRNRADAEQQSGDDPRQDGRERFGQHERRLLRDRRAALGEPPQFGSHITAQRARRQPREREQEYGGRAADEEHASRCRTAGRARLDERVVGCRQAELAVCRPSGLQWRGPLRQAGGRRPRRAHPSPRAPPSNRSCGRRGAMAAASRGHGCSTRSGPARVAGHRRWAALRAHRRRRGRSR